ncbi:MAG TPA: 3',5'-cyclic-nucleotide phosphodiesterase, partial [Puia sp.]|nr:3',5'-cyclic-nucleotide phosphodiesterase [Puia sp.]
KGGLDESDLSAYMVAPLDSTSYICLDAGTLYAGIRKAIDNNTLSGSAGNILRTHIKGYCISHPHLDHVAGLIINSPDDTSKTIYGMPYTLKVLEEKYFTWAAWANFADAGEKPILRKYHYMPLTSGEETALTGTSLRMKAYPLSHGEPYQSTAFLIRSGGAYLLYLGDTGADTIEHAGKLQQLWQVAGPLIKAGRLHAIFIETSFPNSQPEKLLFGHLTPHLLMGELQRLGRVAGSVAMQDLPVVITHRKPSGDQEKIIQQELQDNNPLHVKLIFPTQGVRLDL